MLLTGGSLVFLAIYSKSKSLQARHFEAVTQDFALGGKREVKTITSDGFMLCYASAHQKKLYLSDKSWSFVSGHISFENLFQKPSTESEAAALDRLMSNVGTPAFAGLEGAFAAIHYNISNHSLSLVNDKFGAFPLFVLEDRDVVIVSNEYQPLSNYFPKTNRKPDLNAIAEFYTFGAVLGSKTFFKNISNLAPASYQLVSGRRTETKKYWEPAVPATGTSSANNILELFRRVNNEYCNAGLTDMCLLSAGADSRLILSTLTDAQRRETKFYTSNLSFLNENEDRDVVGARLLSLKFGLQHRVEKISFFENRFDGSYFAKGRELRKDRVYGGWHGGEFLGGYFLKSAPISADPGFKAVDRRLKGLFSLSFRLHLKKHPYESYLEEKNKLPAFCRETLFPMNQMLRSFFTSIYGGSRGHWLQPFQLTWHGLSPFWDSRFLQKLLGLPLTELQDYALYNEVLKLCGKEFTSIPSNSPLTLRSDSVIPPLNDGVEPKSKMPDMHHQTYLETLANTEAVNNSWYNKNKLAEILKNEQDAVSKRWLDFETWRALYLER